MKKTRIIISALSSMAMLPAVSFPIYSCTDPKKPDVTHCTITWGCNDSAAVKAIHPTTTTIEAGMKLSEVITPTYEVKQFWKRADDNWYSNKECTELINPDEPINSDINIYAKFVVSKYCTVTWECNSPDAIKSITPASIVVPAGTTMWEVEKPTVIFNEGYSRVDDYWYFDDECTQIIQPDDLITDTITVYMNIQHVVKITWGCNNPDAIESITPEESNVLFGTQLQSVEKPTYKIKKEYEREDNAWYSNKDCTDVIPSNYEIESSMNIYAKFKEKAKYTVTWSCNNPGAVKSITPSTIDVHEGTRLDEIDKPVFEFEEGCGRADNYWYSDQACTEVISPDFKITQPITLYAKVKQTEFLTEIIINNGDKASLVNGYTIPMTLSKEPFDATDEVKWSSSDQTVATVSDDGVVQSKKVGTTTITVSSTRNPEIKDTCVVTVKENTPLGFAKDGKESDTDPKIWFNFGREHSWVDIEYTKDISNPNSWQKWPFTSDDSPDSTKITLDDGEKLYVRNNKEIVGDRTNPFNFKMEGCKVKSFGNIESMNNYQDQVTCEFLKMFKDCTLLSSAPDLPSTQLAFSAYESTFEGCTSLTAAPELHAAFVPTYAYYSTFKGSGLKSVPALPATQADNYACQNTFDNCDGLTEQTFDLSLSIAPIYACQYMFANCDNLVKAPYIRINQIDSEAFGYMFNNCPKLNYLKVGFGVSGSREWPCTFTHWLEGVSNEGTFIWRGSIQGPTNRSSNTVPNGWTIETY